MLVPFSRLLIAGVLWKLEQKEKQYIIYILQYYVHLKLLLRGCFHPSLLYYELMGLTAF